MLAIKDYKPRSKSNLNFKKGDVVEVIEKNESGWASGCKLEDNTYGNFPFDAFKVSLHFNGIMNGSL